PWPARSAGSSGSAPPCMKILRKNDWPRLPRATACAPPSGVPTSLWSGASPRRPARPISLDLVRPQHPDVPCQLMMLCPSRCPAARNLCWQRVAGRGGWLQTCVVGPAQGRSVSEGSRDAAVIRTPDRRLRVFVSSTLGELAEERRAVARAISALRLTPVMFEL